MRLEFTYVPEDLDEWAKAPKPQPAGRSGRNRLRVFVLTTLIVLAVPLAQLLPLALPRNRGTARPPPPPPDAWRDTLLSFLPWVIIFLFIWFIIYRQMRRQGRTVWEQNPDLPHPHVVTVGDEFVEVEGPKVATRFRWSAFDAWSETANLLLLRHAAGGAYTLIPKRAATAEQQAALRATFAARVVPPTGGFPVVGGGR